MRTDQASILDWLVGHDPLEIVPLEDPVIDAVGFDPRSPYVEVFWLPVIGPSATWAARAMVRTLGRSPNGVRVPVGPFAAQLGLGGGVGRHSPVIRTFGRLVTFGLAEIVGDQYAVRRTFPPLARRHVLRLPPHLAALHPETMTSSQADEHNAVAG